MEEWGNEIMELVKKEQKYLEIHDKILKSKSKVELYLYEMCLALKEMHDGKYYLSAGYTTFEAYTVENFNIKKTQAYEYLKLADKRSKDFFQTNGQIGLTKLQLLNSLSEEEAEEFLKDNDIQDMTVKEVKRTFAAYKDKKENSIDATYEDVEDPINDTAVINIVHDIPITSFGSFVKNKRLNKGYSIRFLARMLNISHAYLVNIEAGRKGPFNYERCEVLSKALELTSLEKAEMYDLANKELIAKGRLPEQLRIYLMANQDVSDILTGIINVPINEMDKLKKIIGGYSNGKNS